jgi:tetratricopeptide (TPR) repeat protein
VVTKFWKAKFFLLLLAGISFLPVLGKASVSDMQTAFVKSLSPQLQKFLRENPSASKYLNSILEVQLQVRSISVVYTNDLAGPTADHYCPKPDRAVIELENNQAPLDEYLGLVYELFNSSHNEKFQELHDKARAKKIPKRDYVRALISVEQESYMKLKSDLPHVNFSAKDIAASATYESHLNVPENVEEFFLKTKNAPEEWSPPRDYGEMYDRLSGRNLEKVHEVAHEGAALVEHKKWDEAIKKLTNVVKMDPEDALSFYNLGKAYLEKGDTNAALQNLSESIRLDNEFVGSYVLRARLYESEGRYREAIMDHREAMRICPTDIEIRGALAWTYLMKGDRTNAFAQYQAAINLGPKKGVGYVYRGEGFLEIGDWANALKDFREGFNVDTNELGNLVDLALTQACCPDAKFRDGRAALSNAQQVCHIINWTNARCVSALAAACAETGDFAEAAKWQQKSVALGGSTTNRQGENLLELYKAKKPRRFKVLEQKH